MPYQILDPAAVDTQLDRAARDFERGVPTALVVKEGVVS
jgi:hypothetical protein